MKISDYFSLRDFLNYYIAGVLWVLNIALLFPRIIEDSKYQDLVFSIKSDVGILGPAILSGLVILIPYVIGFVLTPLGNFVSRVARELHGDPRKWVTDHNSKGTFSERYRGKRLAKPAVEKAFDRASEVFGYSLDTKRLWFYQIRAYIAHHGGAASRFATRTHDLANFVESLFLPVPILGALFVFRFIPAPFQGVLGQRVFLRVSASRLLSVLLAIVFAVFLFLLLIIRYLELFENWVKHIYRAFLVMTLLKKGHSPPVGGENRAKKRRF